jgi:hypothetical protein
MTIAMPAEMAPTLREAVRETEPPGAFDARAIRELYKAAPTDPKGTAAHDPPQRATSDRPAGGFDDLRAGAPRGIPAAVLSHRALRGVGPGRGDGLAAEPAGGREHRGEEGAGAGCSKEERPADQREGVRRPTKQPHQGLTAFR